MSYQVFITENKNSEVAPKYVYGRVPWGPGHHIQVLGQVYELVYNYSNPFYPT